MLFRYSRTLVTDRAHNFIFFSPDGYSDSRTIWRMADGIVKQIIKHLGQPVRITPDFGLTLCLDV